MDQIITFIGILGSFFFAISGAITAMRKKFDPFGVIIIGFVTAVGGGTLRDVLLTTKIIFWFADPRYIYFILAGTFFAIIFRKKIELLNKPLLLFDAIGLGLYTIVGVEIGLQFDLALINCIILGVITGSFGGVIRDILVNEVPVIFKKEVYATVSILGAVLYVVMHKLGVSNPILQIVPIFVIIVSRMLVVYFKISLPSLYRKD